MQDFILMYGYKQYDVLGELFVSRLANMFVQSDQFLWYYLIGLKKGVCLDQIRLPYLP